MQLAFADTRRASVLVLLHGFPLSREMWASQITEIGKYYRVIAPDLRGHGDSSAPEGVYTMDEMADDVIELSTGFRSSSRWSWGGCRWGDTSRFRWCSAIQSAFAD